MFCFKEFAFTVQVKYKINSIQIFGFILICLYFTTGHFHPCVLCKECSQLLFLIIGSVFSDCVVFYVDYTRHKAYRMTCWQWPWTTSVVFLWRAACSCCWIGLSPSARAASLSLIVGTSTVPVVDLRSSGSSALCRARFPMMDRELCQAMGWRTQRERWLALLLLQGKITAWGART